MGIVMAIMAVTALNRLNLSIAGKYIEEEFSFSTISMGTVFSAFLWGYGLFQIPWGYVCGRIWRDGLCAQVRGDHRNQRSYCVSDCALSDGSRRGSSFLQRNSRHRILDRAA